MLTLDFSDFPVLETERLLLRNITIDDAPEVFFLRSDKQVMQYLDREPCRSIEEAKAFIEMILGMLKKNESILWTITLKNDPATMIGTIGYWRIEWEHYRAEIGYVLH